MPSDTDIVAVDGGAATGKSACHLLAERLGYQLLETGLIYRAVTRLLMDKKIGPDMDPLIISLAVMHIVGSLSFDRDGLKYDGRIMDEWSLRDPILEKTVPIMAKKPEVRRCLIGFQRGFNGGEDIVVEGRDIGSAIFPQAQAKIFLTARIEIRAKRRYRQIIAGNLQGQQTLADVEAALVARDRADVERENSPLICPPDALVIDTSDLTIEAVADAMYRHCIECRCVPRSVKEAAGKA